MRAMSYFPTAKRSACDRCRAHKLRCIMADDKQPSCVRCLRAGAPCVIGYTRPKGRQQSRLGGGSLPLTHIVPGGLTPPYTVCVDPTPGMRAATTSPTMTVADGTTPVFGETATWDFDCYDYQSLSPGLYEGGFPEAAGADNGRVVQLLDWAESDGLDADADMAKKAGTDSIGAPGEGAVDCEARLCKLNLYLCQQMGRLRATSGPQPAFADAVGNALKSTDEFSTVLRLLLVQNGEPRALAAQLDVAACHVRVLALFDLLLQQLQDPRPALETAHSPPPPSLSPVDAVLPGMQLAGFFISHSALQRKILVQTVRHQLEEVEGLLGLPPVLRVSEAAPGIDLGSGLLQGAHSAALHRLYSVGDDAESAGLFEGQAVLIRAAQSLRTRLNTLIS